ncbi:LacI family DNA-binding transcriptional regulator [Rhizobium rhizosphaerae]|uniref:LacI family DNA-binding transcriptional regulator n=1 Tax=Xaviernesmea rhizosphaerae TaxID=1672749 RepID=UPI000A51E005|nr:LacI family DNA-binding transcriptional regulator [Xaviernesmea rhizosphaerae]
MSEEPGRRRTIRDVAKAAGVSIATASNALNGMGRTNAETRERVRRIADEIGFRPNALARSLLTRRSHSIGIITNDTYGRLTLPMSAGVSEALVDHGVSAFLCATNNDPRLAQLHLEALLDKQVDGIIFTATRLDLTPPVDLTRLPIPVVYAFAIGPETAPTFIPDDAQGARLAVRHLQERGYRRILHITGQEDYLAARLRAEAYRDLAGEQAEVMFGAWSEEWGHEAVRRLISSGRPRPEAIFCGSDEIARGVIDSLRDHGLKVPEDVAVVGFDNWQVVAAQTRPPLTTVDMELKELGRRAGLAMLDLTRGLPVAPGITRLPCSLVTRRSCGLA